jgi:hypothetical protein
VPTVFPTTVPTALPVTNAPAAAGLTTASPVTANVRVVGSLQGFLGKLSIQITFNMQYSTTTQAASLTTTVVSDGTNSQYFFFSLVPLSRGEALDFTVNIQSLPSEYNCLLSSQSQFISYPSNSAGNLSSPLFSSNVLVFCSTSQIIEAVPPQVATGLVSFPSSVNALVPQILTPGSPQNSAFTSAVGTVIAHAIGASNTSIVVTISYDSNGVPQISAVMADSSGASLCGFSGNITVTLTLDGITFDFHIGKFEDTVTTWALAQVNVLKSLPLYLTVPLSIGFLVLLVVLVIILRRVFPNVKIKPLITLLLSINGLATNILFLNYLNTVRTDKSAARLSACVTTSAINPLANTATILLIVGILSLLTNAVYGWFVSSRLMCRGCSNRISFLYSSRNLLDIYTQKVVKFESFKRRHRCAIAANIVLCGLSPVHLLIMESNLGGCAVFKCPFPSYTATYIQWWDLIPVFLVFLPFTVLQLAASISLSGWTTEIVVSITLSSLQIVYAVASKVLSYLAERYSWVHLLGQVVKRCFLGSKHQSQVGPSFKNDDPDGDNRSGKEANHLSASLKEQKLPSITIEATSTGLSTKDDKEKPSSPALSFKITGVLSENKRVPADLLVVDEGDLSSDAAISAADIKPAATGVARFAGGTASVGTSPTFALSRYTERAESSMPVMEVTSSAKDVSYRDTLESFRGSTVPVQVSPASMMLSPKAQTAALSVVQSGVSLRNQTFIPERILTVEEREAIINRTHLFEDDDALGDEAGEPKDESLVYTRRFTAMPTLNSADNTSSWLNRANRL